MPLIIGELESTNVTCCWRSITDPPWLACVCHQSFSDARLVRTRTSSEKICTTSRELRYRPKCSLRTRNILRTLPWTPCSAYRARQIWNIYRSSNVSVESSRTRTWMKGSSWTRRSVLIARNDWRKRRFSSQIHVSRSLPCSDDLI